MKFDGSKSLGIAAKQGAWFGFKASLAIFGSVFIALYGGGAGWWLFVRITRGAIAAWMMIEEQGGVRALESEFWMAAGRVVWLTICCTLLSALIFAVCAVFSGNWRNRLDADASHPLDP